MCRASIFTASSSCCPSGWQKKKKRSRQFKSCILNFKTILLALSLSIGAEEKVNELLELYICIFTCAICVIVLVYEDVVQDEGEQFGLQRVLWGINQRIQVFSASGHHLVAEDEQEITQDGECLQERGKIRTKSQHV